MVFVQGDYEMTNRKSMKKQTKNWVKITLVIVLLVALGTLSYSFLIYNNAKKTVNEKMHEPIESINIQVGKKKVKATKPLNILLLGIDARKNERGRSDALMVLTLDPKNDAMQLVSIPRDTRTTIIGRGNEDKINHAYAFGGTDMAVATVENFLDIDLDYYVSMNMKGLEELVNELGTITVDNDTAWDDGTYQFTKGLVEMDGDKTMHFVRMRKQDPSGDFGRTKRQRKVIQAIIERGASVGSVTKINNMIQILGNNMATNLDFDDMKKLLTGYSNTRKNFTDYQVQGTGQKINGVYYLIVSDEEVAKVHKMIADIKS